MVLGALGPILLLAAVLVFARRRHRRRQAFRESTRVGDDDIRRILEHGRIEVEEPLDLEDIREEEKRFWEEERWE